MAVTRYLFSILGVFASVSFLSSDRSAAQCGHPHGRHIVVNVSSTDAIGGLAVRRSPNINGERIGVIPSWGTGITTWNCGTNGWCEVKYQCLSGWAYAAAYLSPEHRNLYRVVGVSASDPEGLNVRSGPGGTRRGSLPYNATNVVGHSCENARDGSRWCLVSWNQTIGWAFARHLERLADPGPGIASPIQASPPPAALPPPATAPGAPPPPAAVPAGGPAPGSGEACKMFPLLCD